MPANKGAPGNSETTDSNRKLRILVVDDENGVRTSLAANLELDGYDVMEAADGYRALELVREYEFDLVITDMMMPGLNGLDTFRGIKKLRPDAVVMIITAFAGQELLDDALNEGAYTVVFKPVNVDRLLRIAAKALKRQTVLIVDDSVVFADSLVASLRDIGLRVAVVDSGAKALGVVEHDDIDVCVVDLQMPEMDGLETYRRLRALNRDVSVIAITGATDAQLIRGIIGLGAYTCLRKPFAISELVHTIARVRGEEEKRKVVGL